MIARKERNWAEVMKMAAGMAARSQEAVETFWDELVLFADPRGDTVPEQAVKAAVRAALQVARYCDDGRGEAGQGVIEYLAIIGLVAIVLFLLAGWLLGDSGILEQLQSTLRVP